MFRGIFIKDNLYIDNEFMLDNMKGILYIDDAFILDNTCL